jgi:hypothetical protein
VDDQWRKFFVFHFGGRVCEWIYAIHGIIRTEWCREGCVSELRAMGETHFPHVNQVCPYEANRYIREKVAVVQIEFQKHQAAFGEGGDGLVAQER